MISKRIPLSQRFSIWLVAWMAIAWTQSIFAQGASLPVASVALVESASQTSPSQKIMMAMTSASFKKKQELVVSMVEVAGPDAEPVLEKLLAGEVFFSKQNNENLIYAVKTQNGYRIQNAFDVEVTDKAEDLDKKAFKKRYKKIRLNNSVRKTIKAELARIALTYGDEAEKMKALDTFLKSADKDVVGLVRELIDSEASEAVKEKMSVLLAVDDLSTSYDPLRLSKAVDVLGGRLEGAAKRSLEQFSQRMQDSDTEDAPLLLNKAERALGVIADKVEFYLFVEKLFFGLSLGSVLLLAAIGLAITFGVMGVINMAHGEMIMIGAYTTYVVQLLMPNLIGYSLFVAIPLAFLTSACVGILIQRLVIRHLHGRPLETLLATFGISLILQQAVRSIFSPLNRQVASPEWMSGAMELNPVLSLTYNRLYILAFSLLVFLALVMIIKKTSLGLNVRAVSQNRDMAKAMGVRTEWVDAMTFGLGSGVAGVAGVALSQLTNVGPNLGQAYIIDSFMVVVFGGVGNLLGTLVGSFTLGVANKFMEPVTGAVLANILILVFIILFIQKRPKGLFPQKGRAAE